MSTENATDKFDWDAFGLEVEQYKERNAVKAKSKDGSDSAIRMIAIAGQILDGMSKVSESLSTVVTSEGAVIAFKVLGCAPWVGDAFKAMLPVLESMRDSKKVGKALIKLFQQVDRLIKYVNEVIKFKAIALQDEIEDDDNDDETIQSIMLVLDECFFEGGKIAELREKNRYLMKNAWRASADLKIVNDLDDKIITLFRERTLIDIMKKKKILKGMTKLLDEMAEELDVMLEAIEEVRRNVTDGFATTHSQLNELSTSIKGLKPSVQTDSLLERVRGCKIISDFVTMYDSKEFQSSLKRIENDQGDGDPEDWAKEWAFKMRSNDEDASQLNDDRKACLQLLYTMCDCWKPKKGDSKATVSEEDIVAGQFRDRMVIRILNLCVVMDRAQALYKMRVTGHPVGMHWYAQKHVDEFDEWKVIDTNYRNLGGLGPLINKRIFWLVDLFHPRHPTGALKCWLEPKEMPHLLVAADQRVDSNISALSDSVAQTKVSDSKPVS